MGKLFLVLSVALALGLLIADMMVARSSAAALVGGGGHGVETVAPAHSPISIAFAVLGPAVVLMGLLLSHPGSLRPVQSGGLVAGLTLLYADGLVHWLAVLEHLGEPPSVAFFLVAGGVQVGAVPLIRHRQRVIWGVGVALTLFLIELYIITRIVPPPFSFRPESVETLGVVSKGIEFAVLAALGVFFGPQIVPMRLRRSLVQGPSLALLFLGALASLITIDLEVYWYWWLFSMMAFVVTGALLIGLIAHAALAYYLRTGFLVGLTWSFAAMIVIVHGIYAVNYASAALVFPLLLCIVSGGLLSGAALIYRGQGS